MEATRPNGEPSLIHALLVAQADLTAVERFAQRHEAAEIPAAARRYRELIPTARPGAGQQYAFEVDLDLCTGCKACVTGCHAMNGLDDDEVWRTVGLLHGGRAAAPALQTVTTSCHHCVEPGCLSGCPARAYEKDPVTGIVKHLDDQCIGCSYCVLMCPYDAPKLSARRGIVRKCDMCSDRLAHGEAPACVQSCPNEAIRISVVEQAAAVEAAEAGAFLPGAPAPADTIPTTVYKSARPLPVNLLPADFHAARPDTAHPPLTLMLVLTQLSVGAVVLHAALGAASFATAAAALAAAGAGLGASLFHLGRPQHAWRAVLGARTSWLSREILAFGLYAALAFAAAVALAWPPAAPFAAPLELAAALAGVAGVACSVLVYVATGRAAWRPLATTARFVLTSVLLGAATAALTLPPERRPLLLAVVAGASALKLAIEAARLRHLLARATTPLKRGARLLVGPLLPLSLLRVFCGALGGVILPLAGGPGVAILALALAGELLERHLFFVAAAAPRMPGTQA